MDQLARPVIFTVLLATCAIELETTPLLDNTIEEHSDPVDSGVVNRAIAVHGYLKQYS